MNKQTNPKYLAHKWCTVLETTEEKVEYVKNKLGNGEPSFDNIDIDPSAGSFDLGDELISDNFTTEPFPIDDSDEGFDL